MDVGDWPIPLYTRFCWPLAEVNETELLMHLSQHRDQKHPRNAGSHENYIFKKLLLGFPERGGLWLHGKSFSLARHTKGPKFSPWHVHLEDPGNIWCEKPVRNLYWKVAARSEEMISTFSIRQLHLYVHYLSELKETQMNKGIGGSDSFKSKHAAS